MESNDLDENNIIETEQGNSKEQECHWIQVGIVSWGDGALLR